MYANLRTAAAGIKKEMKSNGKFARIEARAAKHEAYAKSIGFASSRDAFKVLGKKFLDDANNS